MSRLAIIIPAYKGAFLEKALNSIANQSCTDFTVYVGDDASPDSLEEICSRWRHRIDLHYHRFNQNLGGRDLVAQWERCIALSQEPWLWLFGDDDMMDANCVESFLDEFDSVGRKFDIYRFNTVIVDEYDSEIRRTPDFPEVITAEEFILKRFRSEICSFLSDYIFSRDAFVTAGGFQSFPRAWCSDDAACVKLSGIAGIKTIDGPRVKWRLSGLNISSRHDADKHDKMRAALEYLGWVGEYLKAAEGGPGETVRREIMLAGRHWLCGQARLLRISLMSAYLFKYSREMSNIYSTPFAYELYKMLSHRLLR